MNGAAIELSEEDLPSLNNWKPIEESFKKNWKADGLDFVRNRNKKQEFLISFDEKPKLLKNGLLQLNIEVLYKYRRGFKFSCCKQEEETLNREFWPTVVWLMANFIAPRLTITNYSWRDGNVDVTRRIE